jgi:arylsulfatase A-like enzyme
VVLIVIDSLRADHVGAYGNEVVRTPAIDSLAAEGVLFSRVYPEAMPTVPMRRTIMTGLRAFPFTGWKAWEGMATRPGWQPIMPAERTIVEDMRDAGFHTSFVSDNPFLTSADIFETFRARLDSYVKVPGQRGERRPAETVPLEQAARWLPEPMRDEAEIAGVQRYLANNGRGEHAGQTAAARVFRTAARELDRMPADRPFFMVVDSFDPHEPWVPPRRFVDMYGDPAYDGPEIATIDYRDSGYLTGAEIEHLQATYKASVTIMDLWLGTFLDRLRERGLDRDTVIALVADHGVLVGEHGWTGKGDYQLHPELIHVPLIVRHPDGRGAGTTSDYFANTLDLPPTLMALAGARPAERFEGTDLSPILDGDRPAAERPFTYGGYGNFCFATDGRFKLISANDRGKHKLYDVAADPGETEDVAADNPDVADELYAGLVAEIGGEPPPWYTEDKFDAKPASLPA